MFGDPEKRGLEEITNKFLQQKGKELGVHLDSGPSPRRKMKEEVVSVGSKIY